jgi:hypothetical protein
MYVTGSYFSQWGVVYRCELSLNPIAHGFNSEARLETAPNL